MEKTPEIEDPAETPIDTSKLDENPVSEVVFSQILIYRIYENCLG